MMEGPKPIEMEMDSCRLALKDSNWQEEEEEKTKTNWQEEEEEKTKTKVKRRLLFKNGKRVSEKKKLRAKDFYMKIPKERPQIWNPDFHAPEGGVVERYDRVTHSSNPARAELKSKLISYADRAIQQYNKVESKDYRVVDVESASGYICQGVLYCMTFTAKLPSQDDCDAIAFAAEVYEGLFEIFKEVSLVCKNEDRPVYY